MKTLVVISAIIILAIPAYGQSDQTKPRQPSLADKARAVLTTLQVNKNNFDRDWQPAEKIIEALAAENDELSKHQAALDVYLKACGDKPGCTQPVEAPAKAD